MNTHALQLCSGFAYSPNSLGYCGTKAAQDAFRNCLTRNECGRVESEIKHFLVLYPYLKTIAQATGYDEFSPEVIEAYWLGGDLLKKVTVDDYFNLIENFKAQGVPSFLLHEMEKNIPKQFIPIHLFNILHVGVGRATMSVPFTLNSINNCMIRWGKVIEVDDDRATVKLVHLNENYQLTKKKIPQSVDQSLCGTILKNDTVLAHWGSVVKKSSSTEIQSLLYWTKKLLSTVSV